MKTITKETRTENVILDSYADIELLVTFEYLYVKQEEDFHGIQDTSFYDIKITFIELVIAGNPLQIGNKTNLIPYLSGKQMTEIESQLQIH